MPSSRSSKNPACQFAIEQYVAALLQCLDALLIELLLNLLRRAMCLRKITEEACESFLDLFQVRRWAYG